MTVRNGPPTDERIAALDILRGLALFGMILVHFHQRVRADATGVEDLIGWGVYIFVEQKSWGTFAFLFGAGFAILLQRLEARGVPVVPTYLRRLGMLAVFGIISDVFFGFHILFAYAAWGLVLLPLRHWSSRALLVTAALVAAARPLASLIQLPSAVASTAFRMAAAAAAEQGSYAALLATRWRLFVGTFPHSWRDLLPDVNLALFIVGLLAVRHEVLADPKAHVRTIRAWMLFGAAAWAVSWTAGDVIGLLQDQWLCFTYIGAVVLLLAFRPEWTRRLGVFAVAGRMALTNYMLQAAVLDVLSSAYGANLKLRPFVYPFAAAGLFGVEAAFSRMWLARHRFGPLEWLWRIATYGRGGVDKLAGRRTVTVTPR
jgi:uncharacterized protein